jgi:S1-C subfamily serine protease
MAVPNKPENITNSDIILISLEDKSVLIEYNVTVSDGERPVCGGTVVKSTENETLVLTAAHCIFDRDKKPMEYGYVDFNDDDKYRVEVIDFNRKQDLALLKVTDSINIKEEALLAPTAPVASDKIWVLGFGAGVDDIMSDGIISKADVQSKWTPKTHCSIIDASAYYGNSGGGVFNEYDELVGVLIQNGPQHPGNGMWNYAVHLDEIKKFLERWLSN